jgi:hypothetical protein
MLLLMLVVAALITIGRMAMIRGWIVPIRVAGGSMAPALLGPHYVVVCRDCGFAYACGVEHTEAGEPTTCPNCGFPDNLPADPIHPGERVYIDRYLGIARNPSRWEMVAFSSAGAPDTITVKRVAGLPRERVAIRKGDIYADGVRQQKTLGQLREMAVEVYDSKFRSAIENQHSRWTADDASGWSFVGQPSYQPSGASDGSMEWASFSNWPCFADSAPPLERTQATPIRDDYAYNPHASRGPLHVVQDLLVELELSWEGEGQFALRLDGADHLVTAHYSTRQNQVGLALDDGSAEFKGVRLNGRRRQRIEFAVFDGQAIIALEGRILLRRGWSPPPSTRTPVSNPLALGVEGLEVAVYRCRIFRDVYFFGPDPTETDWLCPEPLGEGQYLLLGDNVPVSIDSRFWPTRGMPASSILGRVIR